MCLIENYPPVPDFEDDITTKDTIHPLCKTMSPEDLALVEVPSKEQIRAAMDAFNKALIDIARTTHTRAHRLNPTRFYR